MTIALPTKFTGNNYEDYLGACLLGSGYFVESHIHLRSGTTELLELDLVATPIIEPLTGRCLLEAKTGSAGFSDLFKMYGWMQYIGISHGCLVRTSPVDPHKLPAFGEVAQHTGVRVMTINLDQPDLSQLPHGCIAVDQARQRTLIAMAWYGRLAQRECLAAFNSFAKSSTQQFPIIEQARQYRLELDQSYFARTPLLAANAIYRAFQKWPGITGQIIGQMAGGDGSKDRGLWDEVRDSEHRPGLQFVLSVEHTARLSILKNVVLHGESGGGNASWNLLFEATLPSAFRDSLNVLRTHPHRLRLPLLFQLFIEVFGGWYSLRDNSDAMWLSEFTGIPVDEIPGCLALYDTLFPTNNGWFFECKGELRLMKMVPAIYHGTGAFLRSGLHNQQDYSVLFPQMGFLVGRWHNALYRILEPSLKVEDSASP